jgi:mRNA (guanine-N7-)-methyltransferase
MSTKTERTTVESTPSHKGVYDRSGVQVFKKRVHTAPDGKQLCAYGGAVCTEKPMENYEFCEKHILQDPRAPFKQCGYIVFKNPNKNCENPVKITANEDSRYCNKHKQMLAVLSEEVNQHTKKRNQQLATEKKKNAAASSSSQSNAGVIASNKRPREDKTNTSSVAEPATQKSSKHKYPSKRKRGEPENTEQQQQNTVEKHYDDRPERDLSERQTSEIFYMRQFNNWVKSILIQKYVKPGSVVFDLCCGKGGDLKKFQNAHIKSYVGADIALRSVQDACNRYNASKNYKQRMIFKFDATFIHANCIENNLDPVLSNFIFDCVSCQFALHYSFGSEEHARKLLFNATCHLKNGGYFLVTCPDAYVLVKKLRAQPPHVLTIGNEVYRAEFTTKRFHPNEPFGNEYKFYLKDAIDECPEYLVPPNTLTELAKEYKLQLVETMNFHEVWERYSNDEKFKTLTENVYKLKDAEMSLDEWEAIYLYRLFVFQKQTGEESEKQEETPVVTDAQISRFKELNPQTDIIRVLESQSKATIL